MGGAVGGFVIDHSGCGPLPGIAAITGVTALLLFRLAQRFALAKTS